MTIAWGVFEQFRRPRETKTYSWADAQAWANRVEAQRGAERDLLAQKRQNFDRLLADLGGDPSTFDWTSFLPLRRGREEDWSDWLAQLIGDSATGHFAHSMLSGFEGHPRSAYARPDVRREVSHEDYRADLLITWPDASYSHVEVKVGDPNLAKTLGTALRMERRCAGESRRRSDVALLLPTQLDAWRHECDRTPELAARVRCLTWIDVARALRWALPVQVGESLRWRVWAHAFCGAIEQDLLRLRSSPDPEQWAASLSFGSLSDAARLFEEDRRDAR